MAQLPLYDVQRHALARQLDCVSVTELVRNEAPADGGLVCEPAQLLRTPVCGHGRPRVGPEMMQNSGPAGSSSRCEAHAPRCSQPQSSTPTWRRRSPLPLRISSAPRRGSRSRS